MSRSRIRSRRPSAPTYTVQIIRRSPDGTESSSLTILESPTSLREVALHVQDALRRRWRTTDLADRRHKRRF